MEDAALLERAYTGNGASFAAMAELEWKAPGVFAAVVPRCPERSVLNCVTYSDAGALGGALPRLAATYEALGVRAWTVWVPEADRDAMELLAAAGHRLDGRPVAMGAELAGLPPADEVPEAADSRPVGPLNDAAYGYEGSFAAALEDGLEHTTAHVYVADHDGVPASCVVTLDHGHDCHVGLVATRPEAQRRGLAGRLLAGALAAAAKRGQRTTTLLASQAGFPVYQRLGYRPVGTIEMWERREA